VWYVDTLTDLTLKTANYGIFHDVIRVNVGQELSGIVDWLQAADMPFCEMLQATKFA
jgi:hypothetical protein